MISKKRINYLEVIIAIY